MTDNVNHPNHYTEGTPPGVEVIDIIRASLTPDQFVGYCNGNVLKYLLRWRLKNGDEDLAKAMVYLDWLIEARDRV